MKVDFGLPFGRGPFLRVPSIRLRPAATFFDEVTFPRLVDSPVGTGGIIEVESGTILGETLSSRCEPVAEG